MKRLKKSLCLILAAMSAAMVFSSCGDEDSDSTTESVGAEAAQADTSVTAEQMADNLFSGIEYVDDLNTISEEMIEKLYGISSDKYTSARVYVGGVSTAEEIACFDAVDSDAADEINSACEKRIAAQITSVEDYNPDELDKLNDPVLVIKGNSVYMCLSNDNDKAEEIIG
ncbi:MAG: DUF4358 domain-containing protein [Ruminococcus sp.]|nr:DUF4358 domain-containing protein [Ruminococcus sp.]